MKIVALLLIWVLVLPGLAFAGSPYGPSTAINPLDAYGMPYDPANPGVPYMTPNNPSDPRDLLGMPYDPSAGNIRQAPSRTPRPPSPSDSWNTGWKIGKGLEKAWARREAIKREREEVMEPLQGIDSIVLDCSVCGVPNPPETHPVAPLTTPGQVPAIDPDNKTVPTNPPTLDPKGFGSSQTRADRKKYADGAGHREDHPGR